MSDLIERQQAIDALEKCHKKCCREGSVGDEWIHYETTVNEIECVPPAQPQRDIPKKPNETIDRAWGISTRQAVCPNCDAYLGMVHFICESDKKKVTYCESCGQAIDWTDWEDGE